MSCAPALLIWVQILARKIVNIFWITKAIFPSQSPQMGKLFSLFLIGRDGNMAIGSLLTSIRMRRATGFRGGGQNKENGGAVIVTSCAADQTSQLLPAPNCRSTLPVVRRLLLFFPLSFSSSNSLPFTPHGSFVRGSLFKQ